MTRAVLVDEADLAEPGITGVRIHTMFAVEGDGDAWWLAFWQVPIDTVSRRPIHRIVKVADGCTYPAYP